MNHLTAMFADRADTASIEAAADAGVSACIVDGLKDECIKPIVDVAISRCNVFARMARYPAEERRTLERCAVQRRPAAEQVVYAARTPNRRNRGRK